VNPKTNLRHCFGCRAGGDAIGSLYKTGGQTMDMFHINRIIAVQDSCSGYMYFQERPVMTTGWFFYSPGFTMRSLVRDRAQESNLPCPLFSKEGNIWTSPKESNPWTSPKEGNVWTSPFCKGGLRGI
jgi:hypothetical protein